MWQAVPEKGGWFPVANPNSLPQHGALCALMGLCSYVSFCLRVGLRALMRLLKVIKHVIAGLSEL